MKRYLNVCIRALILLLLCSFPVTADIRTIPEGGTVFIGEEGVDISACGVKPGETIGWWGDGSQTSSEPSDITVVSDPGSFYISPVTFSDKTGAWYTYPDKNLVFYVKEPRITLRIIDVTRDFDATKKWVPTGDTIGFRLDTNLFVMQTRPGVFGAPVDISITTPDGMEYNSVSGFSLDSIPVDTTPYLTGGVWNTAGEKAGYYTIKATCTANQMDRNAPLSGSISEPVQVQIQSINPLIKDFSESGKNVEPEITKPVTQEISPPVLVTPTPEHTVANLPENQPQQKTENSAYQEPIPPVVPKPVWTEAGVGTIPEQTGMQDEPATRTQGPAPAPTTTTAAGIHLLAAGGIVAALFLYSNQHRKDR